MIMTIGKADVWVVDDDEGMRNSTSFVLSKAGVQCSEFASGAEALETQNLNCPQCLVVDFKMPDLNGLEFVSQFQNDHGNVPFVLITGHGTVAMAVEAMKMGAINYLHKPASSDLIEAAFLDQLKNLDDQNFSVVPLDQKEHEYIDFILTQNNGNITKTAKMLGLHRQSLQRKLKKYF